MSLAKQLLITSKNGAYMRTFRKFNILVSFLFVVLAIFFQSRNGHADNKVVVIPLGGSSGAADRFISLPVETAVIINDAVYELNGGGDLSGMALPNLAIPRFATGFSLPPDYIPGTDIVVYITWGNSRFNATNCGIRLRSNGVSAFRPNSYPIYENGVFTGSSYYDGSRITLTMPSESEQIRQTIMTIEGSNHTGNLYQSGDNLMMLIARDGNATADTCTGKIFILGMYATY